MCVSEELKKFLGQVLFVDLVGKEFAPKGILKEVSEDFIILGENRILISNISSFRPARGGG